MDRLNVECRTCNDLGRIPARSDRPFPGGDTRMKGCPDCEKGEKYKDSGKTYPTIGGGFCAGCENEVANVGHDDDCPYAHDESDGMEDGYE